MTEAVRLILEAITAVSMLATAVLTRRIHEKVKDLPKEVIQVVEKVIKK